MATLGDKPRNAAQQRLFELRLKLNASRKANRKVCNWNRRQTDAVKEVEEEHKRLIDEDHERKQWQLQQVR